MDFDSASSEVVVYTLAVNPPATPEEIPEEIKLEQEALSERRGECHSV